MSLHAIDHLRAVLPYARSRIEDMDQSNPNTPLTRNATAHVSEAMAFIDAADRNAESRPFTIASRTVRSEDTPPYVVAPSRRDDKVSEDDATIKRALAIIESRLRRPGKVLDKPIAVKDMLVLRQAELEHEVFGVILLDAQNRAIDVVDLFRGTLNQTSVYAREVVKLVLAHNAAAVIVFHNHPSGAAEPSRADEYLTQTLKQALALVDVRVLDHFVVGGMNVVSFAERGML